MNSLFKGRKKIIKKKKTKILCKDFIYLFFLTNVICILLNLMDKGLEFPNGLSAPGYVVSNAFGEREKKKEKGIWPSGLSLRGPLHRLQG